MCERGREEEREREKVRQKTTISREAQNTPPPDPASKVKPPCWL